MSQPLNIAFFGSSLVSSYWNGAATYYRGIIRALAKRGHKVTFYEPDAFDRQLNRDIEDPDWATVVVYQSGSEDEVRQIVRKAHGCDVVVKASGVGVHDAVLEEAVLKLKGPETKVIFWDVDAPATLERIDQDTADPFRQLIPRFDMILTYGGGRPVKDAYQRFGAKRCVPIYNALDPDTHFPTAQTSRFAADLSFLGNRLPDRELRVDEFFLKVAAALPNQKFLLGGSGWKDKSIPENVGYIGHVSTTDHNSFNSSSKAVLNISRDSMARFGFSPATRVFEAAGAAACIITDAWEGIEMFLKPEHEVLVARDHLEVVDQLAELTNARAAAIGHAARRRILAEHTYENRVEQLERLLLGRESHIIATSTL
jgi:spore maturation protein CgeB